MTLAAPVHPDYGAGISLYLIPHVGRESASAGTAMRGPVAHD
jgi:hypothetical protein